MTDQDEREVDEFPMDDDGYSLCPICKIDDHLIIDGCHNGGGEWMPGWFILCQECNTYAIVEFEPDLRPLSD